MQNRIPEVDFGDLSPTIMSNLDVQIGEAAEAFLQSGFVILRNVFDPGFVQQLHQEYMARIDSYLDGGSFRDALVVGDRRAMVPVRLAGAFSSTEFYANHIVLNVLEALLGSGFILNSLGSVAALPGATDQHVHRDHPNIYSLNLGRLPNRSVDHLLMPPFAITMAIPLVALTEETGNTRYWPGTHLSFVDPEDMPAAGGIDFTAELGTCFLFDYRIIHGGRANKSQIIRPLLYNVYSKPWFRDCVNFQSLDPLSVTPEQVSEVPEEFRHMFDWTLDAATRTQISQ